MDELVTLTPLVLKGNCLANVVQQMVISKVLAELNKVNLKQFKLDNQITEMVMQMIEDCCHEHRKSKIDKRACVIEILKMYFNLNNQEIEHIGSQIEYIFTKGMILVAKKTMSAKTCNKFSKLLGSKKISRVKSSHISSKR